MLPLHKLSRSRKDRVCGVGAAEFRALGQLEQCLCPNDTLGAQLMHNFRKTTNDWRKLGHSGSVHD